MSYGADLLSVVVCTAIFIVKLRQHLRFRSKYLSTEHNKHRCQHNVLSVAAILVNKITQTQVEVIVFSGATSSHASAINCNSTNGVKHGKKEQSRNTDTQLNNRETKLCTANC
ncbi:hypothetical protein Btru_066140 [Bulinus truncatus]|nr:hypothetical protein Btru_066140 [Bulinus truncatus]